MDGRAKEVRVKSPNLLLKYQNHMWCVCMCMYVYMCVYVLVLGRSVGVCYLTNSSTYCVRLFTLINSLFNINPFNIISCVPCPGDACDEVSGDEGGEGDGVA